MTTENTEQAKEESAPAKENLAHRRGRISCTGSARRRQFDARIDIATLSEALTTDASSTS